MRISYNTQAMNANNSLTQADSLVAQSIKRLSSGLKVSSAEDDPSGYAISKRMNIQIEGLSNATQNANRGISVIETADGTLSEISDMVQRMNELAVKASNGTMTTVDRSVVQKEIDQLKSEITRVSRDTEFNGQTILDGTFDLKGYTDDNDVKVKYYNDEAAAGKYKITGLTIVRNPDGTIDPSTSSVGAVTDPDGNTMSLKIDSASNNRITLKDGDGFEMKLEIENGKTYINELNVDIAGFGAMTTQIGSKEGQTLEIRIPEISLGEMGIDKIDVTTETGAQDALSRMSDAMGYVNSARSRLGAYQNRLEHTVSSLGVTSENMTDAYSGIVDVDMAEETTDYSSHEVVSQAATAILAQANQRPSQVLQLLQ
jgi:flagellin